MRNTIRGLATAIALLFICACSQTYEGEENEESLIFSFENPQTEQEFKIVKVYKLYDELLMKSEAQPERSKSDLYNEVVMDPIYDVCFAQAEYIYMADSIIHSSPQWYTELIMLSEEIEEKDVTAKVQQALIKSSNRLPSKKETTVCIFPSLTVTPMFAVGAGKIIVPYNKYYNNDLIQPGIAHEYHHSVWTEKYLKDNESTTVLDNLIFEGKAVMFEKVVYPDITLTPVDERYNQEYWEKIEDDLHKMDLNRSLEINFGGNGLPDLYGYSEGYKMVRSYLELHPHLSPVEWTPIEAQEIFDEGNYIDHYQ